MQPQHRGAPPSSQGGRFGGNAVTQPILSQGSGKSPLNSTSPLRTNQVRPGLNTSYGKRPSTPTMGDSSRPSPRMESRIESGQRELAAGSGRDQPASVWDMTPTNQSFLLPQRQGGASPVPPRGGKGGPMLEESSIPATSSRGSAQLSGGYGGGQRELTPQGLKRASTPQGLSGGMRESRSPIGGNPRGREISPSGLATAGSLRGMNANSGQPSPAVQASSGLSPGADMQPGRYGSQNGFNFQQAGSGPSGTRSGSGMQLPPGERSSTTTRSVAAPPNAGFAELEAKIRELQGQNSDLERKLDEDGSNFLSALLELEAQNEDLTRQNEKLRTDREDMERGLTQQGDIGEARARIAKLEQEQEDVLSQMDSFEKEKEEDLRREREVSEKLRKQIAEAEQENRRRFTELERERESIIEMVSAEGKSAQARIEKLIREKEALNTELAKALANAEAAGNTDVSGQVSGAPPSSVQNLSEANNQLRTVMGEREALKDEVTNKNGQMLLLQSQLDIKDRKLRIADMENAMLKSELEVLRRKG